MKQEIGHKQVDHRHSGKPIRSDQRRGESEPMTKAGFVGKRIGQL